MLQGSREISPIMPSTLNNNNFKKSGQNKVKEVENTKKTPKF
jgi:hypothetical protein